jgi:hypothetical protein
MQYRHKGNVFLFSIEIANRYLNLVTWNFHESGHGKGATDGVGAAIKSVSTPSPKSINTCMQI